MIQLASGETLSGKAGTASAISYHIEPDLIVSGVDNFAPSNGQLPITTPATLFTSTSGQTIIKSIQLTNTTASPVTGVVLYRGTGVTSTNQIVTLSIVASGSATYEDGYGWQTYDGSGNTLGGAGIVTSVTAADGSITVAGTAPAPTISRAALTGDVTASAGSNATTLASGSASNLNSGTLPAARMPALTGDITTSAGAVATTLKNTGPGATGPLGSATTSPSVTIDAQGRVTGLTSQAVTPAVGSITGLGTGMGTFLATPTSANLATAVTDETGSGALVFGTSPSLTTPALGTPSAAVLTNATGLPTTSLTGTLQAGQEPAHTGDATNSAGSLAMSVVKIQAQAVSSAAPAVGQVLEYGPSSTWTPTTMYFNVISFGADPTGSADSTTAINAAVTAASANGFTGATGGIVFFPAGRYKITSTIVITNDNITLMGVGGGASEDFGNYYTALTSALVPSGAFKAVQAIPVQTNGISGQVNYGFKLKGLGVDNYANAGTIGLQLISCQNFDIDDFYAINSTTVGLDFNTLPAATLTIAATWPLSAATLTVNSTAASGTGAAFAANTNTAGQVVVKDGTGVQRLVTYTGGSATTFTGCSSAGAGTGTTAIGGGVQILPGAQDCTRGHVGQISLRQVDGGGASGHGIQLNGDGGGLANTNLINFVGPVKVYHVNGNGINDINSDTNYWDFILCSRSSGTGLGAMIGAGSTNAFASRNNVFNHVSFGAGGFIARGTPTATFPSGPTRIMNYQLANGEALPTVEAGALLDVNFNGAFKVGNLTAPSITTQALTAATVNQINNTKFVVPPQGFQVGTHLVWYIPMIKTAAAGISWLFNVRYGTGAVSTGAILQTITYTATAAADGGILEIHCIITALGTGTSATNTGYAILRHDVTATGLSTGVTAPVSDATAISGHVYTRPTFAGFDSTLPQTGVPQFVSIEINPVTAATVQTIQPGAQAFCLAQSSL